MPRGLILAAGFLTRIPMPPLADFRDEELATSAAWFPLIGLAIGALLLTAASLTSQPWLAALLVLLLWVGISGGLHLDGAADLADALGAAHRDPERLHAVMKDPHTGSFGVIAIVLILLTKLVVTAAILGEPDPALWALLLIPAWGRFGAILWSQTLDAIAPGSGERFKWQITPQQLYGWGAILFAVSWLAAGLPFAIASVAILLLWLGYLRWRLGGMTGDCLGAGIEYGECAMLIAAALL